MMTRRDGLPYWQIATLATLAALWTALSTLFAVSLGSPEALLLRVFENSVRADAFFALDCALVYFWVVHSCLLIFGMVAVRFRRYDVFTVMILGPALACCLSLFSQKWSDPNWTVFLGIWYIGWLVGMVVGGLYWAVYPQDRTGRST